MLTATQLKSVMPTLADAKAALYLPHLNAAMQRFAVNSLLRAAAFVAQLAHESGEFRWMEELWGREPTAAQRRYEPVSTLAAQLGNTQPGDGKRFKGRGPIQITGRANYKRYGDLLGIDLIADPARAAAPEVAFALAGLYWASNHLNELADGEQFVAITKRINGGTNGLEDRQKYYARAKQVLRGGSFGDAPPATRGMPRGGDVGDDFPDTGVIGTDLRLDELTPLSRGAEVVRESADDDGQASGAPSRSRQAVAKSPAPGPTAKGGAAARKTPSRRPPGSAATAAVDATRAPRTAKRAAAVAPPAAGEPVTGRTSDARPTTARRGSLGTGTEPAPAEKPAAGKKIAPKRTAAGKSTAPTKKTPAAKTAAKRPVAAKKAPAKKTSARPAATKNKPAAKKQRAAR